MLKHAFYLKWEHLAWLSAPLLVFILGDRVIDYALSHQLQWQLMVSYNDAALQTAWYTYLAATGIFNVSAIVIGGLFIADVCHYFQRAARQRILWTAAGLAAANALITVGVPYLTLLPYIGSYFHSIQSERAYVLLGKAAFEKVLTYSDHFIAFGWIQRMSNILSACAVSAVMVGAVSTLGKALPGVPMKQAFALSSQIRRLHYYQYFLSSHLLLGVFLLKTWFALMAPAMERDDAARYSEYCNSVTAIFSVYFTTIILSYYVPITFILHKRVTNLEAAIGQDGALPSMLEVSTWRKSMGFELHNWKAYAAILSTVLPLLAGSIGALAKLLK